MATQAYIIKQENSLLDAQLAVQNIIQAIAIERKANAGEQSRHYVTDTLRCRDNRDCWGTLYVNACALRRELDKAIEMLETEFGK